MSYLLETLGRGLLGCLLNAFESQLPNLPDDEAEELARRQRDASTSFDLAIRLGAAYLREARPSDAHRAFETARHLEGSPHLPALGLACVCHELGRTQDALDHLCEARDGDPGDPSIAFAIGLCQEQQGQVDQAAESYQRAVELCPQLRNAYERLGAVSILRGDWSAAEQAYAQLADLEPGDLDILLTLATLRLQERRAEDAAETFQRALLIEPESADEGFEAAAELDSDERLQQAVSTLEKLVEKYPSVTEFRVHLADLYVKAGDDSGAVSQYSAALQIHPTFLEAAVKLGTQHLRRQRYEDAAQQFNRAVELNDRLLTAFVGLGVAQDAAGRAQEAQATFDLAASLAPNSTLLFSETNRLHLKSQRQRWCENLLCEEPPEGPGQDELLVEAIRRHEQILLSHPGRADMHYRRGLLLRQLGDFAAAVKAFYQATAINPSYVKALIKLGITWREMGHREQALDAFRKAMTPDEHEISLHYHLGVLFAQCSQFDLALERFEDSMAGKTGSAEFRHNLVLALQNISMVDGADATWRATCELSPRSGPVSGYGRFQARRDAPHE